MNERNYITSKDYFLAKVSESAAQMPKRMRQCAQYIALHPDEIVFSTVAELAERAGVQPSAMMRFCQQFGFKGYSDLQKLFRAEVGKSRPEYSDRLHSLRARGADSPSSLLAEFIEASHASLEDLARDLDQQSLDKAVEILGQANVVHIAGLRRTFSIASYLSYVFEKMEIPSMLHDRIGQIDQSAAMKKGDALLAISFAPYASETLELIEKARRHGLKIVTMTDSPLSPLVGDETTSVLVKDVDVGDFRVLTAAHNVAATLAVAVAAKRDNETYKS